MFDKDRWTEVYMALKSNKLRTFLTAFGVFWGIFMLIIMLGSGKGLENGVYYGMGDFATNSVFIWAQPTSKAYKGFKQGRSYHFNNEDTKAILDNIPEIKLLAPRIEARGGNANNNVVRGLKTGAFSILGDVPDVDKIDPVNMYDGRFLNDIDLLKNRKVAVIGKRVNEVLFEDDDAVGQYIKINGIFFQVIGVFHSMHSQGWGEWQDQCVFIPFTTLQKTYNYGTRVGHYSITSKDNYTASYVEDKVKALLKRRHKIHPDDERAIGSHNVEKEFVKINQLFMGISGLIWIVGIGTLMAGIIGVSNIMLFIVKKRTKEIGIQRAIGASPSMIISSVITESVVLTGLAGWVGLVIGVALLEMLSLAIEKSGGDQPMFTHPEVDFKLAIMALGILILSGILAGIIPAKRAVSIKPIDAIRDE
ncbi:ABC transporter permease [Ancylomarina euxinus]|uniref:ABC transporter permease n=1 Tax=Ancylomarina euxinus TaxID=2283627 RepID=A0A425Y3L4_9BACT|nr:ABC transporter permease [Ancylomarina euxinus]MCZ4694482.1 ABC transporter permease [Ancylomarina euxinus]MUP14025.1 FtsX-like permease family protein [Ancylomarina euxinus]RRG22885.1 ABC transporter permease [Ancylomarina euxinus]